eukprot:GHVT01002674.1.p1 GENE.GHVT01002674.1~~GHVT01002674.1.p1  ORF type:complete len:138 (-),score=1.81 GHVT01002674.1:413-826(-)
MKNANNRKSDGDKQKQVSGDQACAFGLNKAAGEACASSNSSLHERFSLIAKTLERVCIAPGRHLDRYAETDRSFLSLRSQTCQSLHLPAAGGVEHLELHRRKMQGYQLKAQHQHQTQPIHWESFGRLCYATNNRNQC